MPSNPISRVAKTTTQVYVDSDRPALPLRKLLRLQRLLHFGQFFLTRPGKNPAADFKNTNKQTVFTPPRVDPYTSPPPLPKFPGWARPPPSSGCFPDPRLGPFFLPHFFMGVLDEGKPPTTPNPPTALMAEGLMKSIGKLPE